jgi:hypothetical protein
MSDAGGWILDQDQHEAGSQPMSGLPHFPSTDTYLHSYVCTGNVQRPYYTTPRIPFEHQTQCRFHTERYPQSLTTIAPPLSLNFLSSIYSRLPPVRFLFLEISTLVGNGLLGVYHSNQIHINIVYNNYIYSHLIMALTVYDHYNNVLLVALMKL